MKNCIGVFDSGIGGLTVLNDLINHFPNQNFLYLADLKNSPYGIKTKEELVNIVNDNIDYLIGKGVYAIIIACNTASTIEIKNKEIPIFKIIEPTAKIANKKAKKVGILATNYTIASKTYEQFLDIPSIGIMCSEFVEVVEEGLMNTRESLEIIRNKVECLEGLVDHVILGCTHFNLLTSDIKKILPNIKIIDSSLSISEEIKDIIRSGDGLGRVTIVNTSVKPLNISWFNHEYKLEYK